MQSGRAVARWDWYFYGRERTRENLSWYDYRKDGDAIVVERSGTDSHSVTERSVTLTDGSAVEITGMRPLLAWHSTAAHGQCLLLPAALPVFLD